MTGKTTYIYITYTIAALLLLQKPAHAQEPAVKVTVTPANDTLAKPVLFKSTQLAGTSFDDRIMVKFAERRTPAATGFYYFMSKTNIYGNALVPAGLLVGGVIGHDKQMRQNALYVASNSIISYAAVLLIKRLVKRPRPFRGNYRIFPVYIAGDYSFPSGHSSSSFSTATALSLVYPKWYVIAPSALWAGSVAYSRMYMGLHYPSDVATGSLIGIGTSVYLNTIRNRVQ